MIIEKLFTKDAITKGSKHVQLTSKQKEAAYKWLDKLKKGELEDERSNYSNFRFIILENILGYDPERIKEHNDDIEFQVTDKKGQKVLIMELKGSKADLYKYQNYGKKDKEKPILQAWTYVGKPKREYGICTNYNKFILITKTSGYEYQHVFDFESIENNIELLKEFIFVFSMERLIDKNNVVALRKVSKHEEQEVTKKFYNLYHETREKLIHVFQASVEKNDAIYYSQIILNRLIFIFFIADRGILPKSDLFVEKIRGNLHPNSFTEQSSKIFDEIKLLFTSCANGSRVAGISKFNGGLFEEELPTQISFTDLIDYNEENIDTTMFEKSHLPKFNSTIKEIIETNPRLNPIIINLLILDQHDFNTEVDVTILGHIFEQSLTDIEHLKNTTNEDVRKSEGVYYTPDYVTRYICKNTIVKYLSESDNTSIQDLLKKYDGKEEKLDEKIKNLKVLDPACGSGAFLISAVDLLTIIRLAIYDKTNIATSGQKVMDDSDFEIVETITREIIKNNIFGFDLNVESVEITKLSLFLKMVTNREPLLDLSDNILHGNTMTDDLKSKFPEVMKQGGFDIIIGNPPYIRYQEISYVDEAYRNSLKHNLSNVSFDDNFIPNAASDLSVYFFYHSLNLLRKNGIAGFINSDGWLNSVYGKDLQGVLLKNCKITSMIKPLFNVFAGVDQTTVIIILEKNTPERTTIMTARNSNAIRRDEFNDEILEENETAQSEMKIMQQSDMRIGNWLLYFAPDSVEPTIPMTPMKDQCTVKIGILTGHDDTFILTPDVIRQYAIPARYYEPTMSKQQSGAYTPVVPNAIAEDDGNNADEYILLVSKPLGKLETETDARGLLEYIDRASKQEKIQSGGQDKGISKKIPELYNLANKKLWYAISRRTPPDIQISRMGDTEMKIFENTGNFYSTRRYVGITLNAPTESKTHALLAYLRSSYFALHIEKNKQPRGGGVLEIRSNTYKKLPIPNFNEMNEENVKALDDAWVNYREQFNDEARKQLDNTVFKTLGILEADSNAIKNQLQTLQRDRLGHKKDSEEKEENEI